MMPKMNKVVFARLALIIGVFLLSAPVLATLDEPADAEVEAEPIATEQTTPVSYTALGLADRNSIQLDENEVWIDDCFHTYDFYPYYPFSKYCWLTVSQDGSGDSYVGCNSPFGCNNTQKNHYGLYGWYDLKQYDTEGVGHAGVFSPKWDASKGAYSIGNYRYGNALDDTSSHLYSCTYKWWNLADKKTSNHTKIQSWTGDSRKNENLFWISCYTYNNGQNYTSMIRIWSALSGRPVGYTFDDLKNLKTLDNHEANTHQCFYVQDQTKQFH